MRKKLNSSVWVVDDTRLTTFDIVVVVLILMPYSCIAEELIIIFRQMRHIVLRF
jgi:hypothetical protein